MPEPEKPPELTAEEQAQQQQETPPEPQGEGVEIKLATGQVYKGANWEEAAEKLARAQEEATRAIRDRETQIRELRERSQPVAEANTARTIPQFDPAEYYRRWEKDPRDARRYELSTSLGIPPEHVDDALRYAIQTSRRSDESMMMAEFASSVGDIYADTPENGQRVAQYLAENNLPRTAHSLKLAVLDLSRQGQLDPPNVEQPDETPKRRKPAPTLRSSGGQNGAEVRDTEWARKVPLDKLAEHLRGVKVPSE